MEKSPSEIVKLTERISKDPKSKLFVPLAEEYKKIGDIEMAIHVLSEGLKQNPSYITARSLLGKLLLENGDLTAAQKEFEEVVKAIPDNLLGRRKLGDLYLRQNKKTEALEQYHIALSLNTGDKPFAQQVAELEQQIRLETAVPEQKKPEESRPAAPAEKQEPEKAPAPVSAPPEQAPLKAAEPESTAVPEPAAVETKRGDRAEEALASVPEKTAQDVQPSPPAEKGFFSESGGETAAAVLFESEEPEEVMAFEPIEEEAPSAGESFPAGEETGFFTPERETGPGGLVDEAPVPRAAVDEEPVPPAITSAAASEDVEIVPAEELNLFGEASVDEATVEEEPREGALDQEMEALVSAAVESASPAEQSAAESAPDTGPVAAQSDDFTTDTLAELYIAQGFYEKAIDIYQRMLTDHPESIGLQNKLARVRAMAAASEEVPPLTSAAQDTIAEPAKPEPVENGEGREPVTAADEALDALLAIPEASETKEAAREPASEKPESANAAVNEEEITLDAEILAEPGDGEPDDEVRQVRPESADGSGSAESPSVTFEESAPDIFAIKKDEIIKDTTAGYGNFEPKEYVPPDAALRRSKQSGAAATSAGLPPGKKETIDRLEKWLSTIKKEK